MHTDPDILLCVAGEQVAQRTSVAARWLCVSSRYAEEVSSAQEQSICNIQEGKGTKMASACKEKIWEVLWHEDKYR